MLSRPEVGTREHILLWLGSKPENDTFHYYDMTSCACGTYGKENYPDEVGHWGGRPHLGGDDGMNRHLGAVMHDKSNNIRSMSWGEAYAVMSRVWK